jgi:hypothetical protein
MSTLTTSADPFQRPSFAAHSDAESSPHTVYVVATTLPATAHALNVARALSVRHGNSIVVIVAPCRPITISSARAHAYNLPVEDPDAPQRATPEAVRDLVARDQAEARVLVNDAHNAGSLAQLLPPRASVVLAGPIHQFVETREQQLARKLTDMGYDVTFVPCRDK